MDVMNVFTPEAIMTGAAASGLAGLLGIALFKFALISPTLSLHWPKWLSVDVRVTVRTTGRLAKRRGKQSEQCER